MKMVTPNQNENMMKNDLEPENGLNIMKMGESKNNENTQIILKIENENIKERTEN
jgi:hypothetical protein